MTAGRHSVRSGGVKWLLPASVVVLVSSAALAVPAWAGAGGDRRIEVDYSLEYVLLEGYPAADMPVLIEVYRNATAAPDSGVRIGSFEGTTVEDPQGRGGNILEVNHVGGGQFDEGGDCWREPSTPNIQPGDKVQATLLDGTGNRTGQVDYTFVRDLTFEDLGGSISGRALGAEDDAGNFDLTQPVAVGDAEAGGAFMEARRILPEGRVNAGITPEPDGTFTTQLAGSGGEVFVQFVSPNADGGAGDESITTGPSGEVGEALVGCPAIADYDIISSNPGKVNKTFTDGSEPLVLSGVSFDVAGLSVVLDDADSETNDAIEATEVVTPASGAQTWTASFANADVETLGDGTLTATATYTITDPDNPASTVELTSTKTIPKDVLPPATPSAPDLTASSDTGDSDTDNLTGDTTPTFTGTAETGSTVKLLVNGTEKGSVVASGGNYSVTASALGAGEHSVSTVAADEAGNVSPESTPALTINVDDQAPEVSASPSGGSYLAAQSVGLTSSETAKIFFTRNGTTPTTSSTLFDPNAPISISSDATLKYIGVDAAGNRSAVATENYVIRPNTAPTISGVRPVAGSATKVRQPVIGATVADAQTNLARSNLKLFVDGREITTFTYSQATDRLSYTSTRLAFGRHSVRIVATDPQGLVKSTSWSFRVIR